MKLIPKTKLYSIRQMSILTGKSVRSIYNFIKTDKIDYIKVDNLLIIPGSQIEKIKEIRLYHRPRYEMDGYVIIAEFARLVGVGKHNIKAYVLKEQIEYIQNPDGIYFIPNHLVGLWKQVKKPTPVKMDAFGLKSLIVHEAASALKCTDNTIRLKVISGELKKVQGIYQQRWYVTLDSIKKYKIVQKMVKGL